MDNNVTLDDLIRPFGELFKQYLTNPIFKNNIDFLMKVPIQEKDIQNMMKVMDIIDDNYNYELSDKIAKKPWIPTILDKEETIKAIFSPTPPPQELLPNW